MQSPLHRLATLGSYIPYQLQLPAAEVFLSSLDKATRTPIRFDLDAGGRVGWSNPPASDVGRAGISVSELSDVQRKLFFAFLASSLSEDGYRRVMEVMAAEAFTRPYVGHRIRLDRRQSMALSLHLSKFDLGVWRCGSVIVSTPRGAALLRRTLPAPVRESSTRMTPRSIFPASPGFHPIKPKRRTLVSWLGTKISAAKKGVSGALLAGAATLGLGSISVAETW